MRADGIEGLYFPVGQSWKLKMFPDFGITTRIKLDSSCRTYVIWLQYEDHGPILLIRKSRGYIYGKCKYKVLSIRKVFESKLIWEQNYNKNLGIVWSKNKARKEIDRSLSIKSNFYTNWQLNKLSQKWTILEEASGSSMAPNTARGNSVQHINNFILNKYSLHPVQDNQGPVSI